MNKTIKKRACLAAVSVLGAMVFGLSACGPNEEPVPPYDPAQRVPTDENEQTVSFSEEDYDFYNNYIEFYDGDGDVYDIGDPYVFRYDGKYYLYSSLNGEKRLTGRIPCWVSENLVDWEWGGWAYDPNSTATNSPSYIAFAPEVVYYKGWFYMCESRRGQGHYFFRSASPTGPFELISDNLGMGIDGSFYLHDNGQLYFLSANNTTADSRITWFEIDFPEDSEGNVSVEIDNTQNNIVEDAYLGGWTEGPGYFKRNDYSYFTYTGNHVDSAGYKEAYSYVKGNSPLEGLSSKWNNTTLLSTGFDNEALPGYASLDGSKAVSDYRGLGHTSNVIGPDMDSIWTAYHNANRINYKNQMQSSTRKYNVTQYFTNGSYVLTNGLGNYSKVKPAMPDYSAEAAALGTEGNMQLSTEQTQSVFTAELNFKLTDGKGSAIVGYRSADDYCLITADGTTLTIERIGGGETRQLATAQISVSTNPQAVHTVKVVSGANRTDVYYDNMLAASLQQGIGAGKVGYTDGAIASSTEFTNDAFGTSDYDAIKDLTGSWAAYAYLRGENVGYQLHDAEPKADGVRQGEAEKTKTVDSLGATALVLGREDWVKYAVNSPAEGAYTLNLLIGKQSAGCVFEVIIDNQTITKMEIPADTQFGEAEYINFQAGQFACGEGLHTLKLRVYSGTLDVVNLSTVKNADSLGEVSDTLADEETSPFDVLIGTRYSFMQAGFMTNTNDARTLARFGSKGIANYEFSVDVKLVSASGVGGVLFRMNDYSYTDYTTTSLGDGFVGYYLQLSGYYVGLTKNNYNKSEKIGGLKPSSDALLAGGNTVTVTVRCNNGQIDIMLNGETVIEYFDADAYLSGYIALFAEKDSSFLFSNFEYIELSSRN